MAEWGRPFNIWEWKERVRRLSHWEVWMWWWKEQHVGAHSMPLMKLCTTYYIYIFFYIYNIYERIDFRCRKKKNWTPTICFLCSTYCVKYGQIKIYAKSFYLYWRTYCHDLHEWKMLIHALGKMLYLLLSCDIQIFISYQNFFVSFSMENEI